MKKKLHILFLSGSYPSRICLFNGDHVQKHAEAVATKHQVTVMHVISDKNLKNTIEFTESIINNVKTIIYYIPITKFKFYYFLKAYKAFFKNIDTFDLVHLSVTYPKGLITLYLKWFKNKKYIISEHWSGYLYPQNKSIGFIKKSITKFIIKNASFVCPVSKGLQIEMEGFGLKGNYVPVPNVVNTSLFFPIDKSHTLYTITHISYFQKEKNISGILNVIKQLSEERNDFIFRILGNGDTQKVKEIIDRLQIPKNNIQLEGAKTQKEIAQILQKSNLYISFSDYETFGIVMTEALATGTPVISTNTGILKELNTADFSNIISIRNEGELLHMIKKYLNSKSKIFNTKKMHCLIKDNFSIEIISSQFSDLYYKTLNN